jgi:hypothetical protein
MVKVGVPVLGSGDGVESAVVVAVEDHARSCTKRGVPAHQLVKNLFFMVNRRVRTSCKLSSSTSSCSTT